MKKIIVLCIVLLMSMTVFAGCGNDGILVRNPVDMKDGFYVGDTEISEGSLIAAGTEITYFADTIKQTFTVYVDETRESEGVSYEPPVDCTVSELVPITAEVPDPEIYLVSAGDD